VGQHYEFGPFRLDVASFELRRDGVRVPLERRVFDLLLYLIRHRERVVASEELLAKVWQGTVVTRASLARAIRLARCALLDSTSSTWIATAHGRGYRFVGELRLPGGTAAGEPSAPSFDAAANVASVATARDHFLGRQAELAHMERMLGDACEGRGGVCILAGEPGIGKTRLAEQVRVRATARGMGILAAWCHDGEGAPSYWPWIQLLRTHAASQPAGQLQADLGPHVEVVASVVPDLREYLPALQPRAELAGDELRFRFFDGVGRLLLAAAKRRPLLLLVDDLHSADGPSLRLFDFLAREVSHAPLLMLATHRSADVDLPNRAREVLANVGRHRYCVRLELPGLTLNDIGVLVEAAGLRSELDRADLERVHRRTGGNPFFIRELVRHAAFTGASIADGRVPDAIRDLLMARLSRLSSAAHELLRTASIVGSEWSEDLVRAVVNLESTDSARALDDALASGIVRRLSPTLGRFCFAHALFRETLYAELRSDERRRQHGRAAAWLAMERGTVDPGEVAYHAYLSAELDRGCAAREWTLRSAAHAMSRLAYEDAADHYARALELVDRFGAEREKEVRCVLLVGLGEARIAAGDRPRATKAFLEAARLAKSQRSGPLLARIALGLSPGLMSLEIKTGNEELDQLLCDAMDLCADDLGVKSRLLARLAVAKMSSARREGSEAMAERAVELARESRSAAAEAFARSAQFFVRWTPANVEERLKELPNLLSCVSRGDDQELAVLCRVARFTTLFEVGDVHAAQAEIDALDQLAEELRHPQALWCRLQLRTGMAYLRGQFEETTRLRHEFGLAAESLGDLNAVHAAAVFDIFFAWEEGRDLDALAIVERMCAIHVDWENIRVHALARCGYVEEAQRLLGQLCAQRQILKPFDVDWLGFMVNRAEACILLADRELAEVLYEAFLPYRGRTVVYGYGWGSWGALDRSLGLLAALLQKWMEAEQHFEAALGLNRRLGARPFLAHTHYGYARMLLERAAPGDRMRADQCIAEALAEARALRMTALQSRLETLG
jgi:DNA-binding winged helix-turn-helix (wHTH) protein